MGEDFVSDSSCSRRGWKHGEREDPNQGKRNEDLQHDVRSARVVGETLGPHWGSRSSLKHHFWQTRKHACLARPTVFERMTWQPLLQSAIRGWLAQIEEVIANEQPTIERKLATELDRPSLEWRCSSKFEHEQ